MLTARVENENVDVTAVVLPGTALARDENDKLWLHRCLQGGRLAAAVPAMHPGHEHLSIEHADGVHSPEVFCGPRIAAAFTSTGGVVFDASGQNHSCSARPG